MLKKLFITIGLVCSYLCLIIILNRSGIEEMLNIAISSFLFGLSLKFWVQHYFYLMVSLVILALPFLWLEQYKILEMMLMTALLGVTLTHMFQSRKKKCPLKSKPYKSV
ncbi:hypothetical protein B9T26_06585 [Acinetobacter sp. ANC 4169]|uniref:hypothetical protein n=1 Tax=Acinetobacter sp. ANC 4169 TaxID=1977879 RepID=UPI000A349537|nr:hypothetical protein [Acinetobacter sp. ANC 4169]OTG75225.1 hypothetical protein B9T26_06585 [Acinetobacter sp. ANC 4169]